MPFHGYIESDDEYLDLSDLTVSHEDLETAVVEFEQMPNGSLRIFFDLDMVRVHQVEDGDVYVTLKR